MLIGVPKETKNHESRVGLTPAAVRALADAGHEVIAQSEAGKGIGFDDAAYAAAGAQIGDARAAWGAQLIVKVKEPQPDECARLEAGQVLMGYLHLAADPALAEALMAAGVTAIAYETVTASDGGLPLLAPMSEIAGRMAVQVGATALQCACGGRGVLLAGAAGVAPGKVTVIGGGAAGANAARLAAGLGSNVTILDKSPARRRWLSERFGAAARVLSAAPDAVAGAAREADLVIGTVLVPGAIAPKVLSRETVRAMQNGSALVDVSIDQGGCFETSRPTTHDAPTYIEEGVVHYCVTNMPGAVARTSTLALSGAVLPFVQAVANKGWQRALSDDAHLAAGLNVHAGRIQHSAVLRALMDAGNLNDNALGDGGAVPPRRAA